VGKVCLGKLSEEDCKPLEKHLLIYSARQDSRAEVDECMRVVNMRVVNAALAVSGAHLLTYQ
jgi:hypothetical protein